MVKRIIMIMVLAAVSAFAQSEGAYDGGFRSPLPSLGLDDGGQPGLLDPSRLKVSHAMSFMAGGSNTSDVKSQSVYSTMLQYKLNAPVILSLNFDMPLHSTFNEHGNLTSDNLSSMDYFRNMPMEVAATWMPTDRVLLRVSMIKMPESAFYNGFYGGGYNSFYRPGYYRGW